jgi:hypothetical protein
MGKELGVKVCLCECLIAIPQRVVFLSSCLLPMVSFLSGSAEGRFNQFDGT